MKLSRKALTKIPPMLCMSKGVYRRHKVLSFLLGAILAGSIAAYLMPEPIKIIIRETIRIEVDPYTEKEHRLIEHISERYKVPQAQVAIILREAKKHAVHSFPQVSDILGIVAIESSFQLDAISKSGAKGLAQVLYKPTAFDISTNIQDGVWLLKDYKHRLKTEEATIHAYNVGIGNYLKGIRNSGYYAKFKQKRNEFKEILS